MGEIYLKDITSKKEKRAIRKINIIALLGGGAYIPTPFFFSCVPGWGHKMEEGFNMQLLVCVSLYQKILSRTVNFQFV